MFVATLNQLMLACMDLYSVDNLDEHAEGFIHAYEG